MNSMELAIADGPVQEAVEDGELAATERNLNPATGAPSLVNTMGSARKSAECPFDLRVPRPALYDFRKLCSQAGKPFVGSDDQVPILIMHGLTPFPHEASYPEGVWGMGYDSSFRPQGHSEPASARTVGWAPKDARWQIGGVKTDLRVGVKGGGAMEIPGAALPVSVQLPGFSWENAKVHSTGDARFNLAIDLTISLASILAGPYDSGGIKFNFYNSKGNIAHFHPMAQLVCFDAATYPKALQFSIRLWVRQSARFLGMIQGNHWPFKMEFENVLTPSLAG